MEIKDILATGIGAFYLAKEKVEEELEKLVEKGKISREEMKGLLEKARQKGESEEVKIKEEVKKMVKEALDELGVATKEDLEELKKSLKS